MLRRYQDKEILLTTLHEKSKAISYPFSKILGANVLEVRCNTDSLGTFSGEIKRKDSALKTAESKARLGMQQLQSSIGLANEGSFGPHPFIPFISSDTEIIIFIDDNLEIKIHETLIDPRNNFAQESFSSIDKIGQFLKKINFPSHGVIVKANQWDQDKSIFKGIVNKADLERAFKLAKNQSTDSKVWLESDMRAHVNPTRMRVIRKLAIKLALRIKNSCPSCDLPGFGKVISVIGLPCEYCGLETESIKEHIIGCVGCKYTENRLVTKKEFSSAFYCKICNP